MEKLIKEECLNIYMFFKVLKQFNLFNEYLNTLYSYENKFNDINKTISINRLITFRISDWEYSMDNILMFNDRLFVVLYEYLKVELGIISINRLIEHFEHMCNLSKSLYIMAYKNKNIINIITEYLIKFKI